MLKYIKSIYQGLFMLIVAFSYSIYFIAQTGFGLPTTGPFFQIYSGVLAVIVFAMFFSSMNRIPSKAKSKALLTVISVVFLFYITRFFYNGENAKYSAYFLSTGVRFVPAILAGVIMLKDEKIMQSVERALLPFVVFYTVILGQYILTVQIGVNMADTFNIEGGMNYQTMSYYSIFAFGLTLYILSYSSYPKLIRYGVIGMALLQLMLATMAGSRGAFVLAFVLALYFGAKKFSMRSLVLYGIMGMVVMTVGGSLISNNALLDQGFNRIFNFFSDSNAIENDDRWIRWGLAWDAFLESPIWGNGIGSVFYIVGFYSHNIFTDLLCEGGLILTIFFLTKLKSVYTKSKALIKFDQRNEIMVVIFLCSFVNICFSGYYLSESGIWVAMAYILGKPIKRIR